MREIFAKYPYGYNEPVQQQSRLVGLQGVVKYDGGGGGVRGAADDIKCFGELPHRSKNLLWDM